MAGGSKEEGVLTWVELMVVFDRGRGCAWCVCFVLVAPGCVGASLAASAAKCCARRLKEQHVVLRSAWQVSSERCSLPASSSATK